MDVSAIMVPASKVKKCTEWDRVDEVMNLMSEHKISAVVVMREGEDKPVGLVTKTDLVEAYHLGVPLHQRAGLVMVKDLDTILETDPLEKAAAMFENQGHRHAVVVNDAGRFVGLINAWDIATECACAARAFPWTDTRVMAK